MRATCTGAGKGIVLYVDVRRRGENRPAFPGRGRRLDPNLDPYLSCLMCLIRPLVALGVRG